MRKLWLIRLLVLFSFYCYDCSRGTSEQASRKPDPDEYVSTVRLIRSKGYQAEEHRVVTRDGYILRIHRIPAGINRAKTVHQTKKVVLLQHGLLDCSSTWVINFPDQSLGYILADSDYDVWLGNVRGNTYALEHVHLNKTQNEFWDFSWSEMAKHDLPAMINYILDVSGQPSLYYIGHSQGSLIGFAGFSENQELAAKVRLFVALGPVATTHHIISPIKYLASVGKKSNQEIFFDIFGRKSFLPSSTVLEWLADKVCSEQVFDKNICKEIIFLFCGPSKFFNQTRLPVYTTHTPAGSSVKDLTHFAQITLSGKFQQYDYGQEENVKRYNQTEAPEYSLKNVQVPVALYSASNDWLADPKDVEFLRANLPHIIDDYELVDWDHLDFIWGLDSRLSLYPRILKVLQKF